MSDEKEKKVITREDKEIGKSNFQLEGVKPIQFRDNEANCFILSTTLARDIAAFFYDLTEDVVGALVQVNQAGKLSVDLFLQNNAFKDENKFKAVIPTATEVRSSSIVDQMRNVNSAKNAMLALTDDAKAVFEQFLFFEAPRKKIGNLIVPEWNKIFFERPVCKNTFGINPSAVATYGIVTIDPERVLAKMYGEKCSDKAYYQYKLMIIGIANNRFTTGGVAFPNYSIKISRYNEENVRRNSQEIGMNMNNDLGFITPF